MRKELLALVIFACLLGASVTHPTHAHVLQTDGTVGALLHINPEDDPIAGEPSTFFLEFKDTAQQFHLDHCTCITTILRNNQPLYTTSLTSQPRVNEGALTFSFPAKDIYQLVVTGQPRPGAQFESFQLTYTIRVAREVVPVTRSVAHNLHLIPLLIGGVVVIKVVLQERKSMATPAKVINSK